MIRIQTVVYPKRKTSSVEQWIGYINSELKQLRGLEKHKSHGKEEKI